MKKNFIIIILFSIIVSNTSYSQRWKAERHYAIAAVGMAHFMGDLGGGAKDAAHFMGVRDLDFVTTRPTLQVGYRFKILERLSIRANLTYANLSARDAASASEGRKARNLSFKTNIWEFSSYVEYFIIKEKQNPRYSFSSLRSTRNISLYVFGGYAIFRFNPKAKLLDTWHELQPLGTEGQGIGDNPPKYSRIAKAYPFGVGIRYNLTRKLGIAIEISNRYTSTDYIDDAHDKYYDATEIGNAYGMIAEALADRHLDEDGNAAPKYRSGTPLRGSPSYNDAYVFTTVALIYNLKRSTKGLPKF